jgi:2-dehydro-3-deoxyphosphogluconate aldolase/(4S)-4-hydroxy-2-oxoglutarate aldolase
MCLLEHGIERQKFFPAGPAGGPAFLKSLASPLPKARFCPTGGVGPGNASTYLTLENVLCVGGSWVTPRDAVAQGDWQRIEALARDAAALAS